MIVRRSIAFVLLFVLPCLGATYPTQNFLVEAPTPQIAQQIGQAAEYYRQQKALQWLGQEMPPWPERCPLRVRVTFNGPGGATSFAFDRGQVLGQDMQIEGPLDRLLASVLPHEVTHTVFAAYFRRPVPRWADEGGAVLSEDEIERERHDRLVRQILNTPGRRIPLRRLFSLHDYPGDVMVLYAEGFSVANFMVETSNRPTFLAFINQGMINGWDNAVRSYYRYNSVEELEQAWVSYLRNARRPPVQLAQNRPQPVSAESAQRVVVRQTVPPMLVTAAPIIRAQAEQDDRYDVATGRRVSVRPGYLPDTMPSPSPMPAPSYGMQGPGNPGTAWQPAGSPQSALPWVQLGPPQGASPRAADIGRPAPAAGSPVGYPH
jgi:hypothetical protein